MTTHNTSICILGPAMYSLYEQQLIGSSHKQLSLKQKVN
jgi:hypothetical protein